jgi:hypothetical protein
MLRPIVFAALSSCAALSLAGPAAAQYQCRAADVTSDGIVAGPDYTTLVGCWGSEPPNPLPEPIGSFVGTFLRSEEPQSGELARTTQCRNRFGAGAHQCTSQEIRAMPDYVPIPGGYTLAASTPPRALSASSGIEDWVSGVPLNYATCAGDDPLAVTRQELVFRFATIDCSNPIPPGPIYIACCTTPAAP